MEQQAIRHPASYRDPSGFIFTHNEVLYRQVNKVYATTYDALVTSGCYEKLVEKRLLISHQLVEKNLTGSNEWHVTLRPEPISVITYPYEWSFDMLRDAALLTLQLMKECMASGFILKDATPYNVQWHKGQLIFIDTLSFEPYHESEPWVAYRQFCEMFLAPLLLTYYKKIPPHHFVMAWPDGVPLEIAARLLPFRSRFSLHIYLHIHLNAGFRKKRKKKEGSVAFSKTKMLHIVKSLETLIKDLQAPALKSTWSGYYEEAGSRDNYLVEKDKVVTNWLASLKNVTTASDLGANDGRYAKLLADKRIRTIAADFDAWCINNLYKVAKAKGELNLQPMVADLANPAAAGGVNNEERPSFIKRVKSDLVLALALIHHLAIGKNIPLNTIADFFSRITNQYLIIEFVPKQDEKVQLMLSDRKDIFSAYTIVAFRQAFENDFHFRSEHTVGNSGRTLFLLEKK